MFCKKKLPSQRPVVEEDYQKSEEHALPAENPRVCSWLSRRATGNSQESFFFRNKYLEHFASIWELHGIRLEWVCMTPSESTNSCKEATSNFLDEFMPPWATTLGQVWASCQVQAEECGWVRVGKRLQAQRDVRSKLPALANDCCKWEQTVRCNLLQDL